MRDDQGPGGGRNRLIREAACPLVASFDDDSWPLDADYFDVVAELFAAHPEAAVISAEEVRPEKGTGTVCRNGPAGAAHKRSQSPFPVACFQNCAVSSAETPFCERAGYLPLPLFNSHRGRCLHRPGGVETDVGP